MRAEGIDEEQIKEEWLVGNAVVAFSGALLMAQAWQPSDNSSELPIFNVTAPTFPQEVTLTIIAFLATLSFVLAVASVIPPLRTWAIRQVSPFSQFLEVLMWSAFLASLLSALSEIPPDQWWSVILVWGGLALILFLSVRMILRPLFPLGRWLARSLQLFVQWMWGRAIASKRKLRNARRGSRAWPWS